jgi:hypothetical protein
LELLPPEILEKIFFPNALGWNGRTLALIVAVRGDKVLYEKTLQLFYKNNTCVLHEANEWSLGT